MHRIPIALALLVASCGPNVSATSGDVESTSTIGEGDDGTFGDATMPDPTATTIASADTTSTDTRGREETTSTSDDSGSVFIPVPDMGGVFECDLWIDNCPVGMKCMPWANDGGPAWNASKCTPLAEDPKSVGEPCTVEGNGVSGIDDCEARAMCFYVDPETDMGECVAFCSGSESNPTCDDPCKVCPITSEGVLILCVSTCDPLAQDCRKGQACYPNNHGFTCVPDSSGNLGEIGDACEFINVCDPGLFCAPPESVPDCAEVGCCAPFCDALAEDPCPAMPAGVECIPWYEDGEQPPCGSGLVGGCMLPA